MKIAAVNRALGDALAKLRLPGGWPRAAAASAMGGLSALALPPFDLLAAPFLTLSALLLLMDRSIAAGRNWPWRLGLAFATGYCFGFGYFLAGLWWIGAAFLVEADEFGWMMPIAVIVLPAGLALFHGLAGSLAALLWKPDWRRPFALSIGFAIAEYLRGHLLTGFPWNSLGYMAMTHEATMQKASVFGLYGVTLISVIVFSAPGLVALRAAKRRRQAWIVVTLCLLAAGGDALYGHMRLSDAPREFVPGKKLRIVQPAIDQSEKWSPELSDAHMRLLTDLSKEGGKQNTDASRQGSAGLEGISLLVWPESTFPFILSENSQALAQLAAMLPADTLLVAGALRLEPAGNGREAVFNSVQIVDGNGVIIASADKMRLVPFGEFLPLRELAEAAGLAQLTHLRSGFAPGIERKLLNSAAGRFVALICYEIIFPGEIGRGMERPDWILNVTNDAWFGLTPGPHQHWRQAVIRSVEEGLPLVRAANSGISSVTDAYGRPVAFMRLGERGVIDSPLPVAAAPTAYSRFGDAIFGLLLFCVLLIAGWPEPMYNTTGH